MQAVRAEIVRTLEDAGIGPESVSLVLRTGGSSSIPAFARVLEEIFDPSVIQQRPVYTTVVHGLATYADVNDTCPACFVGDPTQVACHDLAEDPLAITDDNQVADSIFLTWVIGEKSVLPEHLGAIFSELTPLCRETTDISPSRPV